MLQTTTATNFIENWMLFCLLGKKNSEIISVRNTGRRKQILKILAQFQTEGGDGGQPQCNAKQQTSVRVFQFSFSHSQNRHIPVFPFTPSTVLTREYGTIVYTIITHCKWQSCCGNPIEVIKWKLFLNFTSRTTQVVTGLSEEEELFEMSCAVLRN